MSLSGHPAVLVCIMSQPFGIMNRCWCKWLWAAEHAAHSKWVEAIKSICCGFTNHYVESRGGKCFYLFKFPWLQLLILRVIMKVFNGFVIDLKAGVGVRGKYFCLGMTCIKWLNYSYNNLTQPNERTACVSLRKKNISADQEWVVIRGHECKTPLLEK